MNEKDVEIIKDIYINIFNNIKRDSIDLFLCGGASTKTKISCRDQLKDLLEKNNNNLSVFYPEDLFMELLSKKKYNLLELENKLAENSDIILIICESPGSFVELGAFVNNENTFEKVVVAINTKFKNEKSFIMLGPVKHIKNNNKQNVIFYNSNLKDLEEKVSKCFKHTKNRTKDISLITGQLYFIILLLYFYKEIEISNLGEYIKQVYPSDICDDNECIIIRYAALKRLYKQGMLVKEMEKYRLTKAGYAFAIELLKEVALKNKEKLINKIRLQIIYSQFH